MRKVVGCIFIAVSGFIFSLQWVLRQKAKLENLKEMQKALFLVAQEISFSGAVFAEIAKEVGIRVGGDVGRFFLRMSEELQSNETEKLFDCYQEAKGEKLIFSSQAEHILEDFFGSAGTFSKTMEEEHIDRTLKRLSALEKKEAESFQREKKLSFTLGLCASFGVVMILI